MTYAPTPQTHTPTFDLLWPEKRRVFGSQIRTWYFDAISNGQLDLERDNKVLSVPEMALALHLAGLITLEIAEFLEGRLKTSPKPPDV